MLRIPNSGGALFDGKPYADAIRANPNNPAADGNYYPADGAPEWHVGAGSMANDPRDRKLNNAHLTYVKPEGGTHATSSNSMTYPMPLMLARRSLVLHSTPRVTQAHAPCGSSPS